MTKAEKLELEFRILRGALSVYTSRIASLRRKKKQALNPSWGGPDLPLAERITANIEQYMTHVEKLKLKPAPSAVAATNPTVVAPVKSSEANSPRRLPADDAGEVPKPNTL